MADPVEKTASLELIAAPPIEKRILVVRKRQVMLDEDLADLYGVETGALTRAVRRNKDRFPSDFMFRLTTTEFEDLKSQSGTSSDGHGGRRYLPYVFTEQGVAMLSGVLRSKRAVAVNIEIMRAFVELRRAASSYAAIERRLEELERETGARPSVGSDLQSSSTADLSTATAETAGRVRTARGRGIAQRQLTSRGRSRLPAACLVVAHSGSPERLMLRHVEG